MKYAGTGRKVRFSDMVTNDEKLSLAAKGAFLLLDLLGSEATLQELQGKTSDSLRELSGALEELSEAGYISLASGQVQVRPPETFGLETEVTSTRVASGRPGSG
jgi:hypothetical protein